MRHLAPNRLRLFFLAVYIPLSVSIGMLHSDDLFCLGTGHHVVRNQSSQNLAGSVDHGPCLACLFTAGHIVNFEPFVPVLSPDRALSHTDVLLASETSHRTRSARAPPGYLVQ